MRRSPVFVALLLTAGLSAQSSDDPNARPVPSDLMTVTRAGVFANLEVSSLPAGAPVVRPTALDAFSHGAAAHLHVAPTYLPTSTDVPRIIGATFGWSGRADGPVASTDLASNVPVLPVAGTTGDGQPHPSSQTWMLTLHGGPGLMVVEFKGRIRNRARASATVAIRGRELSFAATPDGVGQRVAIPLPEGADGLGVKIALEGLARGSALATDLAATGVFEAALSVQYRPDDRPPLCTIVPDQRGCPAGGELQGAIVNLADPVISPDRPHIALSLTGALPDAFGVTILNRTGELSIPLPLTRCPILVDPVVVEVFQTDAHGNARTFLRAPPVPIPGEFRFFIQQATLKFGGDAGFQIASSNTLAVKCSHPAIALVDGIASDEVLSDIVK